MWFPKQGHKKPHGCHLFYRNKHSQAHSHRVKSPRAQQPPCCGSAQTTWKIPVWEFLLLEPPKWGLWVLSAICQIQVWRWSKPLEFESCLVIQIFPSWGLRYRETKNDYLCCGLFKFPSHQIYENKTLFDTSLLFLLMERLKRQGH